MMNIRHKSQEAILNKLGIEQLNPMQIAAHKAITENPETILLSPTGTGKTLAFLLPLMSDLNVDSKEIQALILVPSRELAVQIETVIREMGSGFKTNAVYGGRAGSTDKIELKHSPAILIGTPGRIADHLRRENIVATGIKTLVLDEFDKSLEVGFEAEMKEIIELLPALSKKVLTSATEKTKIPGFLGLENPKRLNYLRKSESKLALKIVECANENKLPSLEKLLGHTGTGSGIIFCNLKESIQSVTDYLTTRKISHACFHGDLEQVDRERSLIKFRNGSAKILVATDLAARGIDVPELDYIIHYELPPRPDEFIHRNGRTARMNSEGTAYILKWKEEALPSFVKDAEVFESRSSTIIHPSNWETLYISGGRKDKISKGDIVGLFLKQGNLKPEELGAIELKQDSSFVAVPFSKSAQLVKLLNNARLKTKKVRISKLN